MFFRLVDHRSGSQVRLIQALRGDKLRASNMLVRTTGVTTNAGRSLEEERSEKGKRTRTTTPGPSPPMQPLFLGVAPVRR